MNYTGYKQLRLSDEEITSLYQGVFVRNDFKENEYLIVEDKEGKVVDSFCWRNGGFEQVKFPVI